MIHDSPAMLPTSKFSVALWLLVLLPSGLLVAGAVAGCLWRPDALAALTLVPAWCWPLAGVLPLLAAWKLRLRRLAGGLALLCLVFAVGWVEEVPALARLATSARQPAGGRRVRIVSLNCANSGRALADLQGVEADVLLLQEAPSAERLAEIGAALFGKGGGVLSGGDTAIVARGSIEPAFVDRAAHFVAAVVTLDDGVRLGCVSLRLEPPGAQLDFWSAGFWNAHRGRRAKHRRQLREVAARAGRMAAAVPVVIGGDFNTVPLDRALDELRPQFADAFAGSGRGWGATGTNDWPLFRVDQIWTGPGATPLSVRSRTTTTSDHRMVVCDLVITSR